MNEDKLTPVERAWLEDCKKCHSTQEMPILGAILTPLCKICTKADFHYGTWDDPECKAYGKMPDRVRYCKEYKCPEFEHDKNSNFNDMFDENLQPYIKDHNSVIPK